MSDTTAPAITQTMIPRLTAIITDDEPLARLHLRLLLEQQQVDVLGEAEETMMATRLVENYHPDLLFLDIQMPVLSGMQFASSLRMRQGLPLLVFVTGYSEHAIEAFEKSAFDYLLKPTTAERLAQTLIRAQQYLTTIRTTVSETSDSSPTITEPPIPTIPTIPPIPPIHRLPVRTAYAIRFIPLEEIRYIESRQKAVFLYRIESTPTRTGGENETERINYTLTQLEGMLPPTFIRIHDSYIVPVEQIEELVFLGNHSYSIRLRGGETLPVGRTRYLTLRERLGLPTGNGQL